MSRIQVKSGPQLTELTDGVVDSFHIRCGGGGVSAADVARVGGKVGHSIILDGKNEVDDFVVLGKEVVDGVDILGLILCNTGRTISSSSVIAAPIRFVSAADLAGRGCSLRRKR